MANETFLLEKIQEGLEDHLFKFRKSPICLQILEDSFEFVSYKNLDKKRNYFLQVGPDEEWLSNDFIQDFFGPECDYVNKILTKSRYKSYSEMTIRSKYLSKSFCKKLLRFIKSKQRNPNSSAYIEEIDILPIATDILRKFETDYIELAKK